ncbi:hypothetical protein ACMHYB_00570 [Sorangium sp. So ce1128]
MRSRSGTRAATGESALLAPGPYIDETESLIFVLGDGTALVQTREMHSGRPGMECGPTLVWEAPSQHQICDLEVSPDLDERAAPGPTPAGLSASVSP